MPQTIIERWQQHFAAAQENAALRDQLLERDRVLVRCLRALPQWEHVATLREMHIVDQALAACATTSDRLTAEHTLLLRTGLPPNAFGLMCSLIPLGL